jgi:hypothetical protein
VTAGEDVRAPALACGRDATAAWDRAEAGEQPDEHERDCPHCRAAFADARRLDAIVHRMAADPVDPPPTVLERVMTAVASELRPQDLLVLASPLGPNRLSRPAAAAVLRALVDGMDGLRARSCRIEQGDDGPDATVSMTVTGRFGVDLASATARVRQMVLAAGGQALGVPVRQVDIEVVDVWDDRIGADGVWGARPGAGA